jgi:hypothetical protein
MRQYVCLLVIMAADLRHKHYNREEDIRALLDFKCRLLNNLRVYTLQPLPFSHDLLDLSLPSSSSHFLFCIPMMVGADTHDPGAIATLLAKHLGDCDGNSLRGYACDNATRPIAKMPLIDNKGFCIATLHGLRYAG